MVTFHSGWECNSSVRVSCVCWGYIPPQLYTILSNSSAPFLPLPPFSLQPDGTPRYHANDAEREEGGSPDTVGAVRSALALRTLRSIGHVALEAREAALSAVARAEWGALRGTPS